jgi:hypothetical protein
MRFDRYVPLRRAGLILLSVWRVKQMVFEMRFYTYVTPHVTKSLMTIIKWLIKC